MRSSKDGMAIRAKGIHGSIGGGRNCIVSCIFHMGPGEMYILLTPSTLDCSDAS